MGLEQGDATNLLNFFLHKKNKFFDVNISQNKLPDFLLQVWPKVEKTNSLVHISRLGKKAAQSLLSCVVDHLLQSDRAGDAVQALSREVKLQGLHPLARLLATFGVPSPGIQ